MAKAVAKVVSKAFSFISGGLIGAVIQVGAGLLLSAVLGKPKQPKFAEPQERPRPQDGQENFTDQIGSRRVWYGRNLVGGQLIFGRSRGGMLHRIFVHGQGEIERFVECRIDGRQYNVEEDGRVLVSPYNLGDGGSLLRIETRSGEVPAVPYSRPEEAAPEWGAAHRGDGLWTTYMRCQQRSQNTQLTSYPTGAPTLQWVADCSRVYDPRTGARVFTDNAALVIADWLSHPDGFALENVLEEAELVAAANAANEVRQLASGGTTRMWRLAGSASLSARPEATLVAMLDACAGDLRLRPTGLIGLTIGGDPDPVITLTDDDVLEFLRGDDGPDVLDRYTELPITYVDENLDWTETTADPWVDLAGEQRLGATIVGGPLDLRFAPNHAQARHVGKIRTARDNSPGRWRIRYKLSALPAIYENTVRLDHPSLGIDGVWRVQPYTVSMEDLSVTLDLVRIDGQPRTWSVVEEGLPQSLPPQPPDDDNPPSPATGVQAFGSGDPESPGIFVAFNAPAAADTTHYVAWRETGDTDWTPAMMVGGELGVQISGLADAVDHDIAVIAARRESFDPDAADVTDVRVTGVQSRTDRPAPVVPTGLSVVDVGSGQANVTVTASASTFGRTTEILRNGFVVATEVTVPGQQITITDDPGSGSHVWAARAVSLSGTEGGQTADVSLTLT
ncbi:MAG: hypothetical protein AAGF30_00330 [Pseudomonadota bacterium]